MEDKLIECEKCEGWECQKCAEVSDVEYKALQLNGSRMHWYCSSCNDDAVAAVKSAELIKATCLKYVDDLREELIQHTDSKRKELKDEIETEMGKIREEIQAVREEVREHSDNGTADKNIKEIEMREAKKLNAIFFNVPESQSS